MSDSITILKQLFGLSESTEGAFTSSIKGLGSTSIVSKTKGDRVIWAIVVILTLVSLLVV